MGYRISANLKKFGSLGKKHEDSTFKHAHQYTYILSFILDLMKPVKVKCGVR